MRLCVTARRMRRGGEVGIFVGAGGLPPSALPGISPSRGEIGERRYHHFIR
jgi:hypothetical protein